MKENSILIQGLKVEGSSLALVSLTECVETVLLLSGRCYNKEPSGSQRVNLSDINSTYPSILDLPASSFSMIRNNEK
jgi:hypothetical protein